MSRVAALFDEWVDEDRIGDVSAGPSGGRSPVTFPTSPLLINVYLALGADLTADPNTWTWTDITEFVRYAPGITVTTGRRDESSLVQPGKASLTFDNRDGRFSRKNPSSPYFGQLTRNTPIKVTVNAGSATYTAVEQFVNEWPARWDKSLSDFTVPIQCAGILRRLGQGSKPLHSTEYRQVLSAEWADFVIDYWPLESGTDAASGGNAIPGGAAFTWDGTAPTTASGGPAGSEPLWTFDSDTAATGRVRSYTSAGGGWGFQFIVNMTAAPTLNPSISLMPIIEIRSNGNPGRWRITLDPPNLDFLVEGFDNSDTRTVLDTLSLDTTFFGTSNIYNKNILITLWVDDDFYEADFYSPDSVNGDIYSLVGNTGGGTVGNATSVRVVTGYATRPNWIFGHFMFIDGGWILAPDDVSGLLGFPGETAGKRIVRLCQEEGVPLTIVGEDTDYTEPMGPQTSDTLLNLLRSCEAADGGVLCEKGFGLAYQQRIARYNAPHDLIADVDAGQVDTMEDADDDQLLRNSWTISRKDGSSAVAQDTASIAAAGLYDDSKTLNVHTDDVLDAIAGWYLNLGTDKSLRWPVIGLNFANSNAQALIDQWIALDCGARILINNVPGVVDFEPADVFIEGKTETFDSFTWTATVNTTPASPYRVGVIEGVATAWVIDSGGSTLAADAIVGATSLTVNVTDGYLWSTDPADYPRDIDVGGAKVTVTAVSGASSPQTFTVNALPHPLTAGRSVTVWHAPTIAR